MRLFQVPQCSIQSRNVHNSVLNKGLRDMKQAHSGIFTLLKNHRKESRIKRKSQRYAVGQRPKIILCIVSAILIFNDEVIKWKNVHVTDPLWGKSFGHRWIHLTNANDAELWCFLWTKGWANNQDACDLRRPRAHYDVIVMRFAN